MAFIYKITNIVNQKCYIGKTLDTVEKRWKEHQKDAFKSRNERRPFYAAIRKYGVDAFVTEVLEECNENIASEREVYYIEKYNSFHFGYNATKGGDGKTTVDYDKVEEVFLQNKNCRETARILNICEDTVSKIVKSRGHQTIIGNAPKIKVGMYDKNTDELIMVFNGVREAGRYVVQTYGVAESFADGSHISQCCKGIRKTARGFKWHYIEE